MTRDLGTMRRIFAVTLQSHKQSAIRATLRLIDERLGSIERLLASRESKRLTAIPARECLVCERHC